MPPFMLAVLLVLATPLAAAAQEGSRPGAQPPAGAFLLSYRPHAGERGAFENGYARHLEWHRSRGDSLAWYGWDVLAGPRLGQFVDGTFGMRFAALDARVDPAGDAADAAASFLPHGEPTGRQLLLLRRDLGTATPLENGAPPPLVQVLWYHAGASEAGHLETALAALRDRADAGSLLPYAVYEVLSGTEPGFLLMVWRNGMASFDEIERNPERELRDILTEMTVEVRLASEVWRYRADLSYLGDGPERRGAP